MMSHFLLFKNIYFNYICVYVCVCGRASAMPTEAKIRHQIPLEQELHLFMSHHK